MALCDIAVLSVFSCRGCHVPLHRRPTLSLEVTSAPSLENFRRRLKIFLPLRTVIPEHSFAFNAGMAHSDCGWTCGCVVKSVRSFENTCHTWALLRLWFITKRRYYQVYAHFAFNACSVGLYNCCPRWVFLYLGRIRIDWLTDWLTDWFIDVAIIIIIMRQVQRQSLPLPARTNIPALTADTYLNPLR